MTTINLFASDQLLTVVFKPKLASGDMNSVLLHVDFDSIWDRFTKSAVFFTSNDDTVYEMILTDGECTVPHEVLAESGTLFIGVRGVAADNAVKTSTLVKYKIDDGAPVGEGTTVAPTPDVYQQILKRLNDIESGAVSDEQIEAAVEKYLEENPPEGGGGGNVDLTGYATEQWVQKGYQPKGNYLTEVPDGYAKTDDIPTKPSDIGAQPAGNYALKNEIPSVPVQSVNGKTGAVQLSAEDVGAEKSGAASSAVSTHNTNAAAHNDIRLLIEGLTTRLNALANSDDTTLDQMAEIVAYIKANRDLIDQITTGKVSVSDIVNNLTTNVSNKPLSAAQGVALKKLIDAITVPTKVSQLTNDAGYLTQHQDISGKLDASALPTAINTALAQAKASGEFDGDPGNDYVLTDGDKAEIAALALEMLGGNPIFGVVDSSNNIVVSGNLPDGTYSVKYEMENGTKVNIGNLVLDSTVYYTVKNTLTNCTNSNSATKVKQGGSYSATITANDGYELKSVTATMGGSAVSVSNGKINIASVTGNIVITAVAEEKAKEPTNFVEYNADNTSDWSIWINNARAGSDGLYRSDTVSDDYGTPVVTNYIAVQTGDTI